MNTSNCDYDNTWTHATPLPMDQDPGSLCTGTESRSPDNSNGHHLQCQNLPWTIEQWCFLSFLPQPFVDWRDQLQENHEDGSDNLGTHCSLILGSACTVIATSASVQENKVAIYLLEEDAHLKSSLSCTIVQESLRPKSGKWTTTFESVDQEKKRKSIISVVVIISIISGETLVGCGLMVMLVRRSRLAPTAVIPYTTACSPCRITFPIFVTMVGWRLFWDLAWSWSSESLKVSSHLYCLASSTLWISQSWTSKTVGQMSAPNTTFFQVSKINNPRHTQE